MAGKLDVRITHKGRTLVDYGDCVIPLSDEELLPLVAECNRLEDESDQEIACEDFGQQTWLDLIENGEIEITTLTTWD